MLLGVSVTNIRGRFSRLRALAGVSVDHIAKAIGVPPELVVEFEKGVATLTVDEIVHAIYLVGGSFDYVFFGAPTEPASDSPQIPASLSESASEARFEG